MDNVKPTTSPLPLLHHGNTPGVATVMVVDEELFP